MCLSHKVYQACIAITLLLVVFDLSLLNILFACHVLQSNQEYRWNYVVSKGTCLLVQTTLLNRIDFITMKKELEVHIWLMKK